MTFSEAVSNVDAADFEVTGTTATLVVTGSGTTYDVTASGGNLAGLDATVTLAFATGHDIVDAEANALTATTPTGTNENDYVVDNTAPTVAITVPTTSSGPFTATFTFSEAVTGFVLSDITPGNATASNFTTTTAAVYTAQITPVADGPVTVDVAAAAAQDPAGNGNTVATQASSTYTAPDTTAPTVTSIERQDPSSSPTHEDRLTWRVTFSEAVSNVDAADFEVTGTTATLVVTGSGTTYDVTASGGNLAGLDATVTLAFATGHDIVDAEANALTATTPTGTNENDYVVDNTAPTVAITVPTTSSGPFTATFTFSEAVTGFVLSDITPGNATASNFTTTTAAVYTAQITPVADGPVTVDVAAAAAQDPAGNGNTVATQASSTYTAPVTVTDTTAPRVTSIERQDATSAPTNADSLTWRVTFSEAVTNVDAADFTVTGTTATVTDVSAVTGMTNVDMADFRVTGSLKLHRSGTVAVTGTTDVYDVTASGGDLASLNGTVILSFATGHDIEDTAGNPLADTAPTDTNENSYVVANTAPTVSDSAQHGAVAKVWTARLGRTVAEQVLDAVESRMRVARTPGVEVSLAGERISWRFSDPGSGTREGGRIRNPGMAMAAGQEVLADWLRGVTDRNSQGLRSRGVAERELLLGSSFALTVGAGDGGGLVSVWGRGAVSRFDGREGDLSLDGEVTSGMIGTDWSRGRVMAGLIVGRSTGEGGYRAASGNGVVSATMIGAYPWGRYALSERVELWGAAGYGQETLTLTPEGQDALHTDLNLWMAAAGLRGLVIDGGGDGLTLAAKTDALIV